MKNSPGASDSDAAPRPLPASDLPGDPNCPFCHGVGYLRRDLPLGHPEFGKLEVCACHVADVNAENQERLFRHSNLADLIHLTFDTFKPRGHMGTGPSQAASVENAYQRALHFSRNLNSWLLIQGRNGCGKTHLAAAIANFVAGMGVPAVFITVPDMLDSLRRTYRSEDSTFEDRFEELRQVRLLVLDDFGTQNATPWAQEKLFQLLNYRYINHLPTVITTNLNLGEIEERIRSRLHDPTLVDRVYITAPDFRNPSDDVGHHPLSSLETLRGRTFGNFDLRKKEALTPDELRNLENAVRTAKGYAENPRGWLIFMGRYGCGKTHLAAAIANFQADLGQPPLFISVPDLLDHLRATFAPESSVRLDRRFEEVRSAPLLVLDDLGAQATTPWAQEKLYQLINHRYNTELPTVITTSQKLEDLDERLRTRLEDTRLCTTVILLVGSYHKRTDSPSPKPSTKRNR